MNKNLQSLLKKEEQKQKEFINLIASENYPSQDVTNYSGNILANKYAEGYPGRRYYPGLDVIDKIESMCQKESLKTFKLDSEKWHSNVQPYSGGIANAEIYLALLEFGDKILGMDLAQGGHLSHGHKANISSRAYKAISYGLNSKTNLIDYEEVERLAIKEKPKLIIAGASAYPREISFEKFGKIAKKIGAYLLADISHIAGLIVGGIHASPFPYADVVMTTTHKTLRGPRSAVIFCKKELASKIDKAVFPGIQGGPHEHTIFAKTIAFQEAQTKSFKDYQKQVARNAQVLAKELINKGFNLVTGGTDNHLMLIDLKNKNIDGTEAQNILEKAHILANRNTVPGDENAFKPSGIRIGTPAMTTLGFKEKEFKNVANFINDIITKKIAPEKIRKLVLEILKKL
ncbi:MAG: serine hydroxymethyltransferase [Patescibacteria group bacterium]